MILASVIIVWIVVLISHVALVVACPPARSTFVAWLCGIIFACAVINTVWVIMGR